MRRKIGLGLGPLVAVVVWVLPLSLNVPAHRLAGLMAWVVVWWICETIPLAATSLLGATLLVVLGITDSQTALAPFAHPVVFLFMGGFLIARAMTVHGLDRRIALHLLTLKAVRGSPLRSILGLMAVSLVLSAWLSNTATTAMMLPICLGVVGALFSVEGDWQGNIFIGVAYAASIGGLGTPVGSPPNVIALGMLDKLVGYQVSFFEWMAFAAPVVLLSFLFLAFMLKYFFLPSMKSEGKVEFLLERKAALGRLKPHERNTLLALAVAVLLWTVPGFVAIVLGKAHPSTLWLRGHVPEATAAILAASLLFIFRAEGRATLLWKEAVEIDWGALLLFGGGLSLGAQMFNTGLAQSMGGVLLGLVGTGSVWVLIAIMVYFSIFFTEITSNTASANVLIPLVIAAAQEGGFDPVLPALGVALSCSLAFMLPVATPPNAIMYGSGRVHFFQMMKMGIWMNLVCGLIVLIGLFIFQLWH